MCVGRGGIMIIAKISSLMKALIVRAGVNVKVALWKVTFAGYSVLAYRVCVCVCPSYF